MRLNTAAPLLSGTQGPEGRLLPLKEETRGGRTSSMMSKGRCFRLAAWLALSGVPGTGMAETLPAEEVLLPAPSACRSDRSSVLISRSGWRSMRRKRMFPWWKPS